MRNIYRFWLVAVAAISLAACSMEGEPVVETNEVTKVTITADFNASLDSRSGFGEQVGNIYKSLWDGNEKFHYYATEFMESNYVSNTITSGGEKASIDLTFSGTSSAGGVLRLVTPSTSGLANTSGFTCSVPTTQTPLAESCDPAAHVLCAEYSYSGKMPSHIVAEFQHYAAYGRMTLKNLTLHDSTDLGDGTENYVEKVLITIDNAKQYTLNATNVTADASGNYVFWFACDAATPTSMTVTVFDKAGCTYTKELNIAGRDFSFVKGDVSKFGVDMTDATYTDHESDSTVTAATILTRFEPSTGVLGERWRFYNDEGDEIYIYLNADDALFNTTDSSYSIKEGDYTFVDNTTPLVGEFRINRMTVDGLEYMGELLNVIEASMNVTVNENGDYVITFDIVIGYGGDYAIRFSLAYSEIYDELDPYVEKLATPTNLAYSVSGTSATVTWDAVANAESYYVWCDGAEAQTVTGTSVTFDGLTEGQTYKVTVKAQSTTYRTSDEAAIEFTVTADGSGSGDGGNEGGEDEGGDVPNPWVFDAAIAGGNGWSGFTLTLTGANGDVIVVSGIRAGSAVDVSSVVLNDNSVGASGTVQIDDSYYVVVNLTINGSLYTGTSNNTIA